jgi:hypothetical protein
MIDRASYAMMYRRIIDVLSTHGLRLVVCYSLES